MKFENKYLRTQKIFLENYHIGKYDVSMFGILMLLVIVVNFISWMIDGNFDMSSLSLYLLALGFDIKEQKMKRTEADYCWSQLEGKDNNVTVTVDKDEVNVFSTNIKETYWMTEYVGYCKTKNGIVLHFCKTREKET